MTLQSGLCVPPPSSWW